MKKYRVACKIDGMYFNEVIEGYLEMNDRVYTFWSEPRPQSMSVGKWPCPIPDRGGFIASFPVNNTVIKAIEEVKK